MKFYGQWDHKVDDKGRMSIPSRFKGEFRNCAIIALDNEFLRIYPEEDAQKIQIPPYKIWKTKIDKQGRILIPKRVRKEYGMQSQAILTLFGQGDYLEIRPIKK